MTFKARDFVVARKATANIPRHAVGLVLEAEGEHAVVFFIGTAAQVAVNVADLKKLDVNKTGKGYAKKICNVCHVLKATNKFSINQTDAQGIKTTRPSCNACREVIDGVKLSLDEKRRLDNERPQDQTVWECPICRKRSIVGITANIVRDHCHTTGKGRTWICDSCNTGLGRFKDDINLLNDAIAYLQRFEESNQ